VSRRKDCAAPLRHWLAYPYTSLGDPTSACWHARKRTMEGRESRADELCRSGPIGSSIKGKSNHRPCPGVNRDGTMAATGFGYGLMGESSHITHPLSLFTTCTRTHRRIFFHSRISTVYKWVHVGKYPRLYLVEKKLLVPVCKVYWSRLEQLGLRASPAVCAPHGRIRR
jgi:hypothetical protein